MASLDINRIVLGCGNFGGVGSNPKLIGRGESEEQAYSLLDQAKQIGIYQFDTANTYGGGQSEKILGQWIASQEQSYRARIRISTKVGNPYGAQAKGNPPLSYSEVIFHLLKSLRQLNLSYIDTYFIHEPDPRTPIKETLRALTEALRKKLIKSIGLSNVNAAYVQEFLNVASSNKGRDVGDFKGRNITYNAEESILGKIQYVQNEFNFLHQRDKGELLNLLKQYQIRYVAYSPLAGGLLSGKYRLNKKAPPGSRIDLLPAPYISLINSENFKKINRFIAKAKQRNLHVAESAIRFVLETDGIHSTIIGPRRREHFENLGFKFK